MVRFGADGRFHRQQGDDLEQVVLHDVADRPDRVVERPAALDPDALGHRDLHAAHVVAVPHRLEQGVREPEDQQVLDALLAEVVVDAEDAVLGEHLVQDVAFSSSAEARSRPNGFSTTMRPLVLSPTSASERATSGNADGGIAM